MSNEERSISILSNLMTYLSEDDWKQSMELCHDGQVIKVDLQGNLLSAQVLDFQGSETVRLKVEKETLTIQWIECTCKLSRTKGVYCVHSGAVLFALDRDFPKFLKKLNPKLPHKVKPKSSQTNNNVETPETTAQTAVLNHLDDQIHSVSLVGKGPGLQVRVAIKSGELATYSLSTDESGHFVATTPKEVLKRAVKNNMIRTVEGSAEVGTLIQEEKQSGTIIETRVVKISSSEQLVLEGSIDLPEKNRLDTDAKYICYLPAKSFQKFIGSNWMFLHNNGFIRLSKYNLEALKETKTKKYDGDGAIEFRMSEFESAKKVGPVWIDELIDQSSFVTDLKLSSFELSKQESEWFYVNPTVATDGENTQLSIIDILEDYRQRKQSHFRKNGRWFKIPEIAKELSAFIDPTTNTLKLTRLQYIRLQAETGSFDGIAGSIDALKKIQHAFGYTPSNIKWNQESSMNLRPYQSDGLKWMQSVYELKLGGLLADEMGLGKTHQAMALLTQIRNTDPNAKFLIICPTSVLDHWLDKINEYSPSLNAYKHHGNNRKQLNFKRQQTQGQTYIASYGVLMRDIRDFMEVEWDCLILDEAHYIKNSTTATYKAVCQLNARARFCLTGTPLENRLIELKSVFDFLLPGYLGSDQYFKKKFDTSLPSENTASRDTESIEEPKVNQKFKLQDAIGPFKLRRLKSNVLQELPEKVEDYRRCVLSDEQKELYSQTVELKSKPLMDLVSDTNASVPYLHVFSVISLLKQICNHPALLTTPSEWFNHESGKFELLKEIISEALDSNLKIVVYSHFLDMLDIVTDYLTKEKIEYRLLVGSTKNRGQVVREFQTDPNIKVFCASLLAGGVGIDLTAASVVIHYDRWWNASKENQATDRVHRIGQTRNVQVIKLITKDTLEERIDFIIRKKAKIFENFVENDSDIAHKLDRDDLLQLLT